MHNLINYSKIYTRNNIAKRDKNKIDSLRLFLQINIVNMLSYK